MKPFNKYKKTSIVGLIALTLTVACSDEFLDVPPTGSLANSQVQTKAGAEKLLIGAYSAINGVFGNRFEGPNNWATGSILGGEANKGTDVGDYITLNPVQRFEADPTIGDINSLWRGRYEGIARCNKTILAVQNATDITEADATRITAEARMLRGHFYFDLTKHFGEVPYVDPVALDPELDDSQKTVALTATPRSDVWANIEADFQFAYDNLPATSDQAGRVNKWAAGAYLAKAYLYQHKYPAARDLFETVITNGVTTNGLKYDLLDDFRQVFNAINDNNKEVVMDVEAANETGSVNNANWFDDLNYPYNTGADGPGNCCGFFQPSFSMANSFRTDANGLPLLDGSYNDPSNEVANDYGVESNEAFTEDTGNLDPRIDFTIGRRGIPYLDWMEHPGKSWIRSQPYAGPYSPKKFVYYRSQENTFTDGSSWTRGYATMNYCIIRFADVLLMAAEAEIEAGTLEQARTYTNRVRARAAHSEYWVKEYDDDTQNAANYVIGEYPASQFATQESARQAVRFERKLELGEEGHRFFDLVRWGIADSVLNNYLQYEADQGLKTMFAGAKFTAGKNEVLPIPQAQRDISGTDVLTQNNGY